MTSRDKELQETPKHIRSDAALAGLLALAVQQFEPESGKVEKPELILHRAGLTYDEIAVVTGKKVGAIRKAIQRARP